MDECKYIQKCPVMKTARTLAALTGSDYASFLGSLNTLEYQFCRELRGNKSCPKYIEYDEEEKANTGLREVIEKFRKNLVKYKKD